MHIADAADITVMAQLQPTARFQFLPVQLDFGDAFAQCSVRKYGGRVAVRQYQGAVRRCGAQPLRQIVGDRRAVKRRAAAIDDKPMRPIAQFDGTRRRASCVSQPRYRRGCRIDEQHGVSRDEALIPPIPRLPQRARTNARGCNDRDDLRLIGRSGPLPASKAAIAMRDPQQRRHSTVQAFGHETRHFFAADIIDRAHHREQHYAIELRQRGSRNRSAVRIECRVDGTAQARFAEQLARTATGQQHRRGHNAAPRHQPMQTDRRFFRPLIQMPRGARDAIEHERPINQIAGRQDQRRLAGPEQQPPGRIIRAPCRFAGLFSMGFQPSAQDRFCNRRALFARGDG